DLRAGTVLAGLEIAVPSVDVVSVAAGGGGRHLAIRPRIAEALELVAQIGDRLHAMIDVSDGLATDAGHLADAERLSVEIEAARLPADPALPWQHVVGAGEEHELAFACAGEPPVSVAGTRVTVVGRFVPRAEARCTVLVGGARHDASNLGWEHGR
ncbi:MAG: AIR synthase-related protein, partial [Phycisphaerales bacterium]